MEIYQAAQEYQTHFCDELQNAGAPPNWWMITFNDQGYVLTRSGMAPSFGQNATENEVFITLKRGGIRYFKSLDAAVNAARQIGQPSVEVML